MQTLPTCAKLERKGNQVSIVHSRNAVAQNACANVYSVGADGTFR